MEKDIIKNKTKVYKKSSKLAVVLAASFLVGGALTYVIYGNVRLSAYADNSQIESIASELDCDLGYMYKERNKYVRMQHNNEEPIYVALSEKIDEKEKSIIVNSLDYVFGIVGSIDDRYVYQIVDKNTYDKKTSKSRIFFDLNVNEPSVGGNMTLYTNPLGKVTSKEVANNFIIYGNTEANRYAGTRSYTYTHELLHAFGFNDVYLGKSTNKYQANSVISSEVGTAVSLITPNDYKCLMSLYTKKFESDEQKSQIIHDYKQVIDNYEDTYYQEYISYVKDKFEIDGNIYFTNFVWQGSCGIEIGEHSRTDCKIEVCDDSYSISVKNEETGLEDTYEGDVYFKDGVCVLKEVTLKKGYDLGVLSSTSDVDGYVQDLVLAKDGNSVKMCDVARRGSTLGKMILTESQTSLDFEIE